MITGLFSNENAPVQCSRAGCTADALWSISWRNPKIHGVGRSKEWLACDEHREYLGEFLRARDFPTSITPFTPAEGAQ